MTQATTSQTDLNALADDLLARARESSSGRATEVFHAKDGGILSQVVLGLSAGKGLSEHENPGEALLHVLRGRAVLSAGDDHWELGPNAHVTVPQRRHQLMAQEDSVVILTVARTRAS